jgi:hypothetical protein
LEQAGVDAGIERAGVGVGDIMMNAVIAYADAPANYADRRGENQVLMGMAATPYGANDRLK